MSAFAHGLRDRPVQEVLKLTSRRFGRALRNPAHRRRIDEQGRATWGFSYGVAFNLLGLDAVVFDVAGGVHLHVQRRDNIPRAEPLVTVDGHGADLVPTAFSGNGG